MQYVHLGRSGLMVSRLCLGTMNFGPQVDERGAHAILDRALELGLNFIDTADVYGKVLGEGLTERILGRWFAQGGGRREQVVLATKVYGAMGAGPNDQKLSALHIRSACEASLQRLQTDHLDLYQMHHVWRGAPWEEIWQAFELLIQQGKVIYSGSSNFAGWHLAQAQERAAQRGLLGLVSEQSLYHLNARMLELEVVPACLSYGIGLLPWSPLGGGLLAGGTRGAASGRRAGDKLQARAERQEQQLLAYGALCRELGHSEAQVALAWLCAQPVVCAPILGPRTLAQLESALPALDLTLSKQTLAQLDAIFPGPGAAAPEAYAW